MLPIEMDCRRAQREMGYSNAIHEQILRVLMTLKHEDEVEPLARRYTALIRRGLPEEILLAILTNDADEAVAAMEAEKADKPRLKDGWRERMRLMDIGSESDWSIPTIEEIGRVLDNSTDIKTTVDWLLENLTPDMPDREVLRIIKNAPCLKERQPQMDAKEILNTRLKILMLLPDADWLRSTIRSIVQVLDDSTDIKTTVDWLLENLTPDMSDREVLRIIKNAPL